MNPPNTTKTSGRRSTRAGLAVDSNPARDKSVYLSVTALTSAHTGVKPQVRGGSLDNASRGLVVQSGTTTVGWSVDV